MSKYYYHGIKRGPVLDKTLDIFQSGKIKCMPTVNKRGFNGNDYVSICKKEKEEEYSKHSNNGFYKYVQDSICFVISSDIVAIKPEIIENADKWNRFELIGYMNSKPGMRFSDMFDEWQVRDHISLSAVLAIGLPIKYLEEWIGDSKEDLEKVRKIITLSLELGLDILDSSAPNFVEEYEAFKFKNPNATYRIGLGKFNG